MIDRLKKIKGSFEQQEVDAVLISSVPNITYLTGISNFSPFEREAYVLITKNNQYIFTDPRYSEAVAKKAPLFSLQERRQGMPFRDLLKKVLAKERVNILGVEEDNLTALEYKVIRKLVKLKHAEVRTHRSVKEDFEIRLIKKACQIGDKAFKEVLPKIKLGVSENEVAYFLEESIRKQRGYLSFPTIVAFGPNSSVPHHHTSDEKLNQRDGFVLMDFGVLYNGYCSDMTRTVFYGKASERQKEIYRVVLEAQESAIHIGGVGVKKEKLQAFELDKSARDYIISQKYPSIPHSLGHGVGLEVHEHPYLSPGSKEELKKGMIFSIEPGIYLPGFGGVRIEDLFLFDGRTLEKITHADNSLIEL